MRRLLFALLLVLAPIVVFAQHDTAAAPTDSTGGSAAHGAETEAHEVAHPSEEHSPEKKYWGVPGWILKTANMFLFLGVLLYFVGGPVKKALADRGSAIQRAADEARDRRAKSDQMASEIQARLAAIENEVRAIHERAQAEGERQKRELVAAAEAESQKILQAARNEVDNRLKHARAELTEYAGELAAQRAEQILRDQMTEQDQKKIFQESLREVAEVRS
ncbi:MAG TPA: ATP synthase F0 subunit B [Thermoanaerobaculia bacterium]|nr:ATP synthase F0 subunit B [Thermoanaerobaculia bacterium]